MRSKKLAIAAVSAFLLFALSELADATYLISKNNFLQNKSFTPNFSEIITADNLSQDCKRISNNSFIINDLNNALFKDIIQKYILIENKSHLLICSDYDKNSADSVNSLIDRLNAGGSRDISIHSNNLQDSAINPRTSLNPKVLNLGSLPAERIDSAVNNFHDKKDSRLSLLESNENYSKRHIGTFEKSITPAPILTYPQNGEKLEASNPILKWRNVSGGFQYSIQIAESQDFKNPVLSIYNINKLSQKAEGLDRNKKYYWRARAFEEENASPWSAAWEFTTGNITTVESAVLENRRNLNIKPNPLSTSATIEFDLDGPAYAELTVFDSDGRPISNLLSKRLDAGSYVVIWNAENIPKGVYYCRLKTGSKTITKKLVYSK